LIFGDDHFFVSPCTFSPLGISQSAKVDLIEKNDYILEITKPKIHRHCWSILNRK